jgi:hypothetical protein
MQTGVTATGLHGRRLVLGTNERKESVELILRPVGDVEAFDNVGILTADELDEQDLKTRESAGKIVAKVTGCRKVLNTEIV